MAQIIEVRVRPLSRSSALTPPDGPGLPWRAHLKSPPVDGKANDELVGLVAAHFGCRRAQVSIQSGAAARTKRLRVDLG